MDFNRITAELEFVSSSILSVDVKSKSFSISNSTKRNFGLDIKCSKPIMKDHDKFGKLLMQVDVSVMQEEQLEPDTFSIIMEGLFKASGELDDERFMELLNVNGGAALYSIARSKVEVLSSLVYEDGKIVLPMVNIIQYFTEKNSKEET